MTADGLADHEWFSANCVKNNAYIVAESSTHGNISNKTTKAELSQCTKCIGITQIDNIFMIQSANKTQNEM